VQPNLYGGTGGARRFDYRTLDHQMSRSIEVYNEEFNGHGEMHPYF
jgi:hypothetical protein